MSQNKIALILLALSTIANANITVWKPASQSSHFNENPLNYSISSFGKVPYGHSIIGKVYMANPVNACGPITQPSHDHSKDGSIIVIAKRGDCPFAFKAMNAQNARASLLMFIDNSVEDVSKVLPFRDRLDMTNIVIPSILLDMKSGEKILDYLTSHAQSHDGSQNVVFAIDFPQGIQKNKSTVDWQLSISSYESYKTLIDTNETFRDISQHIEFTPTYYTYRKKPILLYDDPKPERMGDGQYVKDPSEDCLFDGKVICVSRGDSKEIINHENSPLLETLKQMCAFNKNLDTWYQYVFQFVRQCFIWSDHLKKMKLVENLAECSQKIDVNNKKEIDNCAENLYGLGQAVFVEPMIFNAMSKMEMFHTNITPSLIINGSIMRGDLNKENIMTDICESTSDKTIKGCENFDYQKKDVTVTNKEKISGDALFLIIMSVSGIALLSQCGFYCGYKYLLRVELETEVNKRVNKEVNDTLGDYIMTEKNNDYLAASIEKFENIETDISISERDELDYGIEV